ncbi:MAG: DUF2911 domain-containing protein [Bacteroidia bacterium]|nr:DUF2911 domain-containing protein [Bacteroidia bacterium]
MKTQKKFKLLLLSLSMLVLSLNPACAQDDKSKRPSPAATAEAKVGDATVMINYSQPAVKDRTVWGELVPYGEVWRTGANEATTFEVDKDVMIEDQKLPAGKYALFTIPAEDEWTIIFNSESEQWGAYKYDESKDVLRVKVKPAKAPEFSERFKFDISKKGQVVMAWENLMVPFNVKKV